MKMLCCQAFGVALPEKALIHDAMMCLWLRAVLFILIMFCFTT
uniref:Uncharacterized protein n=1 Tax=Anguilla anguilla TaxID=7936 RepID=A0A0E9UVV4_ANGAN